MEEPEEVRPSPIGESSSSSDEIQTMEDLRPLRFADRMSLVSSYIQGTKARLDTTYLFNGYTPLSVTEPQLLLEVTRPETPVEPVFRQHEGTISFLVQFMIPFLMAGFGQLLAGLILDKIQHWEVIVRIPNIYILIPALLGLKGNCEMCLAARLSTQANVHGGEHFFGFVFANLGIVQVHSVSIGLLAAGGACLLGWVPEGVFIPEDALLLTSACLLTASATSLVLGSAMALVFVVARLCHIDPDNVATPIASSLGDLTTVFILANSTQILTEFQTRWRYTPLLVGASVLLTVPMWWQVARRHKDARSALLTGWQPVVAAMLISSLGGLIMEYSILNFRGIAVYQLIVNGVAGNLVAVQASKLSTHLHRHYQLGELVPFSWSPRAVFCSSEANAHTVRILLAMVVPGHLIFNYAVASLNAGHTSTTPIFMSAYLMAAFVQVALLLYVCHVMIHRMWRRGVDPDNSAIPYLTAIADFLGMVFLSVAFEVLYLIGDGDDDIGD